MIDFYGHYWEQNTTFVETVMKLDKGRYMYLAGPYTGPTQLHQQMNVSAMQAYHHMLTSMGHCVVAAPVMCSQYDFVPMTRDNNHEFWLNLCKRFLLGADAMLCMPNSELSKGVNIEREFCKLRKIPVVEIPPMNMTTLNLVIQAIECAR